jgi:hypothetical protein
LWGFAPHPWQPLAALTASPLPPPLFAPFPPRAQGLTLVYNAAWLLPPHLDSGAAALPALTSLSVETFNGQPVARRLFEERGLLARLTSLKVVEMGSLPPLQAPPDPGHCPDGMRVEDLWLGGFEADTAALAAWPMPRLRRLALSAVGSAALRVFQHAPWAAGLQELRLTAWCLRTPGARGGWGGVGWGTIGPFGGRGRGSTHAKGASPAGSTPCLASNPAQRPRLPLATSGSDELALAPLPGLTALTLQGPGIPDDCWPRLLGAPWASRLRRLSILEQPLGTRDEGSGAGLLALAGAPLPSLVDFETAEANYAPADLSGTLAAAPWLGQLTRLKLAEEWLAGAGLAALASLPLGRLECLRLDGVCANEAGLAALGAAPWLTRLTRLEVAETAVHEERDEAFGEIPDVAACEFILAGRGESNPFAPLARAGAIEAEYEPGVRECRGFFAVDRGPIQMIPL